MVLLNTRFYVDKGLHRQAFFDLARKSFEESFVTDLSLADYKFDTDDYVKESSDKRHKIQINNFDKTFIFTHIENETSEVSYITSYVLDDKSDTERFVMSLVQEKIFSRIGAADSNAVPQHESILQSIFWNEYGGNDNGLLTGNDPIYLKKNDLGIAHRIVEETSMFLNPIVYVSPDMSTGKYAVNCDSIAQALQGQAHVVVEHSPVAAQAITQSIKGTHPYNGSISIYVPGSDPKVMLQSGDDFDKEIVDSVREMLAHTAVPDEFNAEKLRQSAALSKLSNDELSGMFESMLGDKDREIARLKDEIKDLRRAAINADAKAENLKNSLENTERDGKTVDFSVTESDLYEGELQTVVLKVLQKERDSMKDDPNASGSRKFHVLSDILDHNFPRTTDTVLTERLRSALREGTVTKDGIGRLSASDFSVTRLKNNHFKITFHNDERYTTIVSSTPSDSRSGQNCVSDFANKLFGY